MKREIDQIGAGDAGRSEGYYTARPDSLNAGLTNLG